MNKERVTIHRKFMEWKLLNICITSPHKSLELMGHLGLPHTMVPEDLADSLGSDHFDQNYHLFLA